MIGRAHLLNTALMIVLAGDQGPQCKDGERPATAQGKRVSITACCPADMILHCPDIDRDERLAACHCEASGHVPR